MNYEYLRNIAICLLFSMTFGLAALEKWKTLSTPDWFIAQFKNSLLGKFPRLISISYWYIATAELTMAGGFLLSIFNPEFLKLNLICALFLFVVLGAGLRMSKDYQGAANLFMYFGVTLVALFITGK